MSIKVLDRQGRWRNKIVSFRVSPEEDEQLEVAVRLSGLIYYPPSAGKRDCSGGKSQSVQGFEK